MQGKSGRWADRVDVAFVLAGCSVPAFCGSDHLRYLTWKLIVYVSGVDSERGAG